MATENEILRAALMELITLKNLKDEESRMRQRRECSISRNRDALKVVNVMRDDYNRRKPLAWASARAALAVAPSSPAAEPTAWQERQQLSPSEWTHWYECKARSATDPRSKDSGGILYEWRPLYDHPPAAPQAAEPAKPFGWYGESRFENDFTTNEDTSRRWQANGYRLTPLYAALATPPQPASPDVAKMVEDSPLSWCVYCNDHFLRKSAPDIEALTANGEYWPNPWPRDLETSCRVIMRMAKNEKPNGASDDWWAGFGECANTISTALHAAATQAKAAQPAQVAAVSGVDFEQPTATDGKFPILSHGGRLWQPHETAQAVATALTTILDAIDTGATIPREKIEAFRSLVPRRYKPNEDCS